MNLDDSLPTPLDPAVTLGAVSSFEITIDWTTTDGTATADVAYTSVIKDDPYVRYVNRWHLEKAEPKFDQSSPKKPIVFWLETRFHRSTGTQYGRGS